MSLVRFRPKAPYAGLAHLVERHLAKVEVASSNLVTRSKGSIQFWVDFLNLLFILKIRRRAGLAHLAERHLAKVEVASSNLVTRSRWRHSQVVRQRSAKPSPPVQVRVSPPSVKEPILKRGSVLFLRLDLLLAAAVSSRENAKKPKSRSDTKRGKMTQNCWSARIE